MRVCAWRRGYFDGRSRVQVTLNKHVERLDDDTDYSESEPPLRIAMFTNLFHPVVSGSATQTIGLARALVSLGHKVIVICARIDRDSPKNEVIDGVEVYRIPAIHLPKMSISLNFPWLNWTYWPANLRRVEEILRRNEVDLVHVHNHMFDMAFTGVAMSRKLQVPFLVTVHTPIIHPNKLYNVPLAFADSQLLRRVVASKAEALISPDLNMSQYIVERFGREDSALIPYGVEVADQPSAKTIAEVKERYGLDGRKVILSLGHVNASRHRVDLVEATAIIREHVPNVLLLVVGSVSDEGARRRVQELGLEDVVRFVGARQHEEVGALLKVADIEAHWGTQLPTERMSPGLASLEAMFAGNAVATSSNLALYGEGILEDGVNIVNVRSGDPENISSRLTELLNNPRQTRSIGLAAQDTAARYFSWGRIARLTADLYRAYVTQKAGARS